MLYDKNEAARLLKVSTKTIDRLRNDGRLNYRTIGSCIRFTQNDLDRFIANSAAWPSLREQQEQAGAARQHLRETVLGGEE
jgi:excisionase family DNA binding protein